MKKILQGAAILFAFVLVHVFMANAQSGKGHGHGHGKVRDDVPTVVRVNRRNATPRTPRRVRRGRNTTPRVPRRAINSNTTGRRNRAGAAAALEHGSGHGRIPRRIRIRN